MSFRGKMKKTGEDLQSTTFQLANGKILIGNGSNLAAAVTPSTDITFASNGVATIPNSRVTRVKQSVPAASKCEQVVGGTIGTTGTANEYLIAPEAGSLVSIEINPLVALGAHDSNYLTWTVVNLGQAGAGSTAMLAVSDLNTTKSTGGVALGIHTKRALTVHGTPANLVVAQGDKIRITATATGTLANTVTVPVYILRFGGTT